ncbi:MAG: hydantoinase/oxoprolinase family protein [Gammaproteobacteria bacterium]|nr:MAG: hydantoinase/oxoprolinase family protein [Gammaproteobacteria bacterium]
MTSRPRAILGVDTGGTFTDFVLLDAHGLRVHKVLSTPEAPERAILQGIEALGLEPDTDLLVVHGSTVATNAVLEGKGVRTAYITNRGLADVLTIGRQARRALYNLQPPPERPPVPPELCLETGGRLGADGSVVEPLEGGDLCSLKTALARLKPQAVAINLLFSWLDDRFERMIEAVVPDGVFVSRSSAVLPELREYERGMATWLNAWVGPLMEGYLQRLATALAPARLVVMQSHGGTIEAARAGREAVRLLLSGPAGGLQGARFVAGLAGHERLLTFDMGGTSTDVALIDGEIRLTGEGHIDRYPVAVPMVDMHTIGAGGGSIARLDDAGMLQVGPESAGASPGPACYGQGGQEPTVTDANLLLGRLPHSTRLGGGMPVQPERARAAIEPLAEAMGLSPEAAAEGIIAIANDHMAQALRVISVQRGLDPADYTLVSFGGAGGLHVCALAEALGMDRALVPIHAGVLSALGMLVARPSRERTQTWQVPIAECDAAEVARRLGEMAAAAAAELRAEGAERIRERLRVDLRYAGQSSTLTLPWSGLEDTVEAFHEAHRRQYGHRLDMPVELVNLRVGVEADQAPPRLPPLPQRAPARPMDTVKVYGHGPVPLYRREALAPEQVIAGPALLSEAVATTWLAPGWHCRVDAWGNLLLVSALA